MYDGGVLPAPRRARAAVPARAGVPALLATGALLLSGCGGGAASSDPTTSAPLSSASATTPPSSSASSPSAATGSPLPPQGSGGNGCAANSDQVPSGAAVGPTADLDHDGEADELWLADTTSGGQVQRLLGVRTASGAVFSTAYTSASPIAATAIGQRLGDLTAVVLLSDGRQVPLFAVVDCELVPTQNAQGQQYTFDLGFTGYGTGVTCLAADGSEPGTDPATDLDLYGLLVSGGEVEGDLPAISRTRIVLSDFGRQARNGATDAPAELQGINPEGPQVAAARSVSCGDQGPGTAVSEPQS